MRDRPWKRQPGALTGVVAMAVVMALAFAGLARARDVPFPTEHTIDAAFNGPRAVVAADVDGDGDADILGAATESHTIAWWENTAGDGTAWTRRIIATGFGRAQSVFAADMDGDGDLDALGAAGTGDRIVWWENTAGDGTAWSAHTVAGFFNGVRWAFPVDLDSDGDLDVVAAASFVNDVAWWENTAGNGTAWARRNIDTSFGGANSVYAADVDGDGDTDVVGAA
ncbi:MAG: VCBS repeat-containing protein, partial [bacterium]|nr:VCBS repeat-containing protein [bacterium]